MRQLSIINRLSLLFAMIFVCSVAHLDRAARSEEEAGAHVAKFGNSAHLEELRRLLPQLGGHAPGELSAQEFVDRPAYRQFYVAHVHAAPILKEVFQRKIDPQDDEEVLRTNPDPMVRASAVLLLGSLGAQYVDSLIVACSDTDMHVRAIAAVALYEWFGYTKYFGEMFPPPDLDEVPQDGDETGYTVDDDGIVVAPEVQGLYNFAKSLCRVSPRLTELELDVFIQDLCSYLDRRHEWQHSARKYPCSTPDNDPRWRLEKLGKPAFDALLAKYWLADEPWKKENVLEILSSTMFSDLREERFYDVLEDASLHDDEFVREKVAMALSAVHQDENPRAEAIRRRFLHDPSKWVRNRAESYYKHMEEQRTWKKAEEEYRRRREDELRQEQERIEQMVRDREEKERRWQEYLDNFEPLTWKHVLKQDWYRTAGPNEWLNMKNSLSPEEWAEVLAAAEEVGVRITLPPEETAQQQTTGKAMTTAPPPKSSEITGSSWKLAVGLGLPFVAILLAFLLRLRKG